MVGKPISAAAGFPGLHAAGSHSAASPEGHEACPGTVFDHSAEVTQDWGRADSKHTPGSVSSVQLLPLPIHLRSGLFPPEYQLIPLWSAAPAR